MPNAINICVVGGPGDVGGTLLCWKDGRADDRIPAVAFSAQLYDIAAETGSKLLLIPNTHASPAITVGNIQVQPYSLPPQRGIHYFSQQLRRGWKCYRLSKDFRSDLCIINNNLEPIGLLPFLLSPSKCVYEMHCTMWPRGSPQSLKRRIKHAADRLIVAAACDRITCVSDECILQMTSDSERMRAKARLFLPFYQGRLSYRSPTSSPDGSFRTLFAGRIEKSKGIYHIVEAARSLDSAQPGRFRWTIAGDGSELPQLRAAIKSAGLDHTVSTPGHLNRAELSSEIERCDATLTPTTTGFAEGLAQLPLESVIVGRPAIVSSVVPASDHLPNSCVVIPPNDPSAIADAVTRLSCDQPFYNTLSEGTRRDAERFLSGAYSYKTVMQAIIDELFPPKT